MPVYNGARFLRQAIESIRNQSFTDWTMLISDDTSTDETESIAREYANLDRRIFYIRQDKNLGLFENFGFTLGKANAPFFMWAAQDDIREKDYLATCIERLEKNPALGLATTVMAGIDFTGRQVLEERDLLKLSGKTGYMAVARYVLQPEILGKCNLMYGLFRIEAMETTWNAYPQRYVWGQDYMFSLALISRYDIYVDPKVLFKKRAGGFSSPEHLLDNKGVSLDTEARQDPKNHIFPFTRFGDYFSGHMEALRGTPYRPLAGFLLLIRLPRAFLLHMKSRNIKKFLFNKFKIK